MNNETPHRPLVPFKIFVKKVIRNLFIGLLIIARLIQGAGGGVLPPIPLPLPPQPTTHNEPRKERASEVLHVIRTSSKPNCPGGLTALSVAWGKFARLHRRGNDPITLSENRL